MVPLILSNPPLNLTGVTVIANLAKSSPGGYRETSNLLPTLGHERVLGGLRGMKLLRLTDLKECTLKI